MLNRTVKSIPFWKREAMIALQSDHSLRSLLDVRPLTLLDCSLSLAVRLPTWIPTRGVKPINAPMAKTMTVKKRALEKLTAAKSTVA